jgi:IPT/TIG domain-containing protein
VSHRHRCTTAAAILLPLLLAACGGGGGGAGPTGPAPTISAVSPATCSPAGGALVTITGTGFSASPGVTFGGVAAAVVGTSATALSVTAPAHPAGAVDVVVTNADGQHATAAAAFTYQPLPAPVLSALSATVGAAAGGEEVTLTGSGFVPPVTVRFGAVQVPVTAQSSTSVAVRTAAAVAGQVDVTVVNPDAQASNPLPFTFVAGTPPPRVDAVSPARGSTLGGQAVSISGAGFSTSTAPAVTFGGAAATVVSVTATALTVTTPPHAEGAVAVTVTNADAQADTLAGAFTFTAPPALASVTPPSGSTGGGEPVVLTGTGFSVDPPPAVTIGGVPAAVAAGNGATSVTVTTPAHGQGPADVVLVNPDGQTDTLPGAFTFTAPAGTPPTVASVVNDATGLHAGSTAGGEAVTITGTGFAPGAQLRFGAAPATGVTWISTTTLYAVTPLDQPAGPVDVTVLLPGTGLAGTLAQGFNFLAPAPVVAAFNVRGSPAAGGGLLLIRGTHLQADSAVTFGGATATTTAFTPGVAPGLDSLTVIIPPSPLLPGVQDGFVDVVVTNPDGQASTLGPRFGKDGTPWPGNFHYGPPPAATAFTPGSGKGLDVTITGAGFSADATGPRSGLQVLFQGPSFAIPPIRTCPNAADAACPAGAVSPAPGSIIVTLPSKQLNPGSYVFVVTNFDGQSSVTPGTFVVP